jgi:hypothetical protein
VFLNIFNTSRKCFKYISFFYKVFLNIFHTSRKCFCLGGIISSALLSASSLQRLSTVRALPNYLLFVLFCLLFVCICVLYYCHRVVTQLQLTNISHEAASISSSFGITTFQGKYIFQIFFTTSRRREIAGSVPHYPFFFSPIYRLQNN